MIAREHLASLFMPTPGNPPVEWHVSEHFVAYHDALRTMKERVEAISQGSAKELVWLLEHPPLYTAGTSAEPTELRHPDRFPVHESGRGGRYTYHGPGQRVAYLMLDLNRRQRDIRAFVAALEEWLISTLKSFDIKGERREDRIGIWVRRTGEEAEDKIAALGIRVRRWITQHGVSLNVSPQLDHFDGIIPCGVHKHGVTSMASLGVDATMMDIDLVLRREFEQRFGPTQIRDSPLR